MNSSLLIALGKIFETKCQKAKMNHNNIKLLMDHSLGESQNYHPPLEQELLEDYSNAINDLTINEENRLKIKVDILESEQNEITLLKNQVKENTSTLNDVLDLIKLKIDNDSTIIDTKKYQKQKDEINSIGKRLSGK